MSKEYLVIAALVVSSILLVTVFWRIKRSREDMFLILMVLVGKLENPVRLFPKATDGNFIMAFLTYANAPMVRRTKARKS